MIITSGTKLFFDDIEVGGINSIDNAPALEISMPFVATGEMNITSKDKKKFDGLLRDLGLKAKKLPKLYRPVTIRFSSLRNGIHSDGAVVYDLDTQVERKAMRVRKPDGGWMWQLIGFCGGISWSASIYIDQECLNSHVDENGNYTGVEVIG